MKITAVSLVTAAAGQLIAQGTYAPLILSLSVLVTILVISLLGRSCRQLSPHN